MTDLYIWFIEQHPILQALLAGLFTWGLTASGAGLVVFFNKTNRKIWFRQREAGTYRHRNDCNRLFSQSF